MFMILPIIFSLLVAILLRKPLNRLANIPLRQPWLVLLAITIQVAMFTHPLGSILAPTGLVPILNTATYALSIIFCLVNFRVRSLLLVALGTFLNGVAIAANGGYMPTNLAAATLVVDPHAVTALTNESIANNSVLLTETTRIPFLTDIFCMPPWMPLANVFSIGDAIIAIGAFLLIQELLGSKSLDS